MSSSLKARVFITLKNGVLDPQGKAIGHALNGLGFGSVGEVRQGKVIDLDLSEADVEKAKAELKAMVIKGPDPTQDNVVRWRCLDLREEVARRFSVEVHESTIGKWLHQLGLTRLQPRPFHPKKDAEVQEAFKKTSTAW